MKNKKVCQSLENIFAYAARQKLSAFSIAMRCYSLLVATISFLKGKLRHILLSLRIRFYTCVTANLVVLNYAKSMQMFNLY